MQNILDIQALNLLQSVSISLLQV